MKFKFGRNKYVGYNVYSMKKYVDKKRVTFTIIVIILVIFTLLLIGYYSINNIIMLKNIDMQNQKLIEISNQLKEKEEKEQKRWEENKNNIEHIYSSETKRVFLTFDDGPSENTSTILNVLQTYGIKANFFVLGSRVDAMPDKVKEIYEKGHFIGNHGYSHIYEQIYSSPQAVLEEYTKTNEAVKKVINQENFNSCLFRFPGGLVGGKYSEIKTQAKELLEQNKILNVDWNALTGDSEVLNPSMDRIMQTLQRTTKGKNSIVLLMHDAKAKKTTAETLPQVIEYFKNQGFEFETFYDVLK